MGYERETGGGVSDDRSKMPLQCVVVVASSKWGGY